jgi:uncharacterized protein (DUF433 family)
MTHFPCITVVPLQMDSVPCIRSLRIPVNTIVSLIAARSVDEAVRSGPKRGEI